MRFLSRNLLFLPLNKSFLRKLLSKFSIIKKLFRITSKDNLKYFIELFKHYIIKLFMRLDTHDVFLSGGGISFSMLLTIIPITLIIFSILGNIIDPETVESQVRTFIDTMIPYPAYASYVTKIIISRVPEVVEYKDIAAYVGVFSLLFIASGLFSSLRSVLNEIFGITADKHLVIAKLRDIGMVILLLVFILFSTFLFPAANIIFSMADKIPLLQYFSLGILTNLLFSFFTALIIFIMFYSLYYFIPYEKLGKRVPAIAAFWATAFWMVAKFLFGYYITNIANIQKIYGTYELIIVVVFWIYYSSVLFIIAAEIAQLYRERRDALKEVNK